jgi:hypothetical protein
MKDKSRCGDGQDQRTVGTIINQVERDPSNEDEAAM